MQIFYQRISFMKQIIKKIFSILFGMALLHTNAHAYFFTDGDSNTVRCTITEKLITIRNAGTTVYIDNALHVKMLFASKGQTHTLTNGNSSLISAVNSKDKNVVFIRKNVQMQKISNKKGKGEKITIDAISSDRKLNCVLLLETYNNFPDAILVQCSFKNVSNETYHLTSYSINHLLVQHPLKEKKWWSFQGASYYWGQDFAFELPKSFSRENYMGLNDTRVGSGVPLVDVWNKRFGIAVAYLGEKPRDISLPVKVVNGIVQMEIKENNAIGSLQPNETITSPFTMIIPHSGDFFQPLQTYSGLMKSFLPAFKKPVDYAYQSEWCTWGFKQDFKTQDVLDSLDNLKSLHIKSVILDDGWSQNHGDWIPNPSKFPNGDEDFKTLINEIHKKDLKVWIWWLPGYVDSTSNQAVQHPDWLVKNKNGSVHPSYALCPAYAPVQEYYKKLVEKFAAEYKLDGLKLDFQEINSAPPCYNPEHHHKDPFESYYSTADLFKNIYETAVKYNPEMLIEYCSCGIPPSIFHLPWINLAVTSDPAIQQTTQRIKMYKALMGSDFPVLEEYCGVLAGPSYQLTIGAGGVPGTFSTYLDAYHSKWLNIYTQYALSKGQYLNLYDIGFDFPEAHTISKDGKMYYAFYTHPWRKPQPPSSVCRYSVEFDHTLEGKTEFKFPPDNYSGKIELRGLDKNKEYRVFDYANKRDLGNVQGNHSFLNVSFDDYLLLEVSPVIKK